ncbi:MAG TPA: entericidin A/B family lipoprotein [Casimicrobiaceae bacterium]|jgi:predicted small secreted protein|nr:entericidin A/B family lipoprotein [Casimicrobiaceae bacterium]
MMKLVAMLLVILVAMLTAACNTVEGVGKDVKATGDAIEKAAQKSKGY